MLSLWRASAPAQGSGERGRVPGAQCAASGLNVPIGEDQGGKRSCDLLFRLWKLVSQRKTEGEGRKIVTLRFLQYFSFSPEIRMKTSLNFPLE